MKRFAPALVVALAALLAVQTALASPDLVDIPDKGTGQTLSATEFNQILDALKSGTRSIATQSIIVNGTQGYFAASIDALAAIPVVKISDGAIGFVATGYQFRFDASSTAATSSPTAIRPSDYASAGVWLLVTLPASMLPDLSGSYATAAKGVTNGDSHDHSGGDGAQIAYGSLSGTPSLGTAAAQDYGTGANQIPRLGASPGTPDGTKYLRDDGTWQAGAAGHTQHTDTGTTSPTFQLDSGNTGPKLKNSSGTVEARNAADNAYAVFRAGSYETPKTSGQAGRIGAYEANSTDTNAVGFEGPASRTGATGADLWFKFSDDDPTAGQAMSFGVPSEGVSQVSWYDPVKYGTTGTGNIMTTGTIAGKVGIVTKSDDYTLGTDAAIEAYGYVVFMSGSSKTLTLPAVSAGMSGCMYSTDANAKSVDPNASDGIRNGTATRNADGHKITSGGNAGDFVCWVADSADGWTILGKSGTWTDE